MTVVLAKQFGNTIQIVSDTMITDHGAGREDAFPGRLKIICLDGTLTVAYAGHADPAVAAIRQLAHDGATADLTDVLHRLREASGRPDCDVEFLVASHRPHAELRRVWNGQISAPLPDAAIGNPAIRNAVYDRLPLTGNDADDAKAFRSAFLMAFTSPHIHAGGGVGGFPMTLEAEPAGHRYGWHGFAHSWKPIRLTSGVSYEDPADLQTGDWSFHHAVMRTEVRGIAVVAAQVPQARLGFIYAPLLDDDPRRVSLLGRGLDWTEHQQEMLDALRVALDAAVSDMGGRA